MTSTLLATDRMRAPATLLLQRTGPATGGRSAHMFDQAAMVETDRDMI